MGKKEGLVKEHVAVAWHEFKQHVGGRQIRRPKRYFFTRKQQGIAGMGDDFNAARMCKLMQKVGLHRVSAADMHKGGSDQIRTSMISQGGILLEGAVEEQDLLRQAASYLLQKASQAQPGFT